MTVTDVNTMTEAYEPMGSNGGQWLFMTRDAERKQHLKLRTVDDARVMRHHPELLIDLLAEIAAHGGLTIKLSDLGELAGAWDPDTRIIWLHSDLTPAAQRSTLMHEIIHAARGDGKRATASAEARQEHLVERMASVILVDLIDMAGVTAESDSPAQRAHALGVDEVLLEARLESLLEWERGIYDDFRSSPVHARADATT